MANCGRILLRSASRLPRISGAFFSALFDFFSLDVDFFSALPCFFSLPPPPPLPCVELEPLDIDDFDPGINVNSFEKFFDDDDDDDVADIDDEP